MQRVIFSILLMALLFNVQLILWYCCAAFSAPIKILTRNTGLLVSPFITGIAGVYADALISPGVDAIDFFEQPMLPITTRSIK